MKVGSENDLEGGEKFKFEKCEFNWYYACTSGLIAY